MAPAGEPLRRTLTLEAARLGFGELRGGLLLGALLEHVGHQVGDASGHLLSQRGFASGCLGGGLLERLACETCESGVRQGVDARPDSALHLDRGVITLPDLPGLGVELDHHRLSACRTGAATFS